MLPCSNMELEEKIDLLLKTPVIRMVLKHEAKKEGVEEQIKVYQVLLEASPDEKTAYELAEILYKSDRCTEALEIAEQYLGSENKRLIKNKIFFKEAKDLWLNEDYSAAEEKIENIEDSTSKFYDFLRLLGISLKNMNSITEVKEFLDKLEFPKNHPEIYERALRKILNRNVENKELYDSAEEFYKFITELDSIKETYPELYETTLLNVVLGRASALVENKKQASAGIKTLDILKFNKELYEAGLQELILNITLTRKYRLKICDLLLEEDPNNPNYWYFKAEALGHWEPDEAIKAYDKAISGEKNFLSHKAEFLEKLGNYKEAIEIYDMIIQEPEGIDKEVIEIIESKQRHLLKKLENGKENSKSNNNV